jgi:hypothetical protein
MSSRKSLITSSKQSYSRPENHFVCELTLRRHRLVQGNIRIRAVPKHSLPSPLQLAVRLGEDSHLIRMDI